MGFFIRKSVRFGPFRLNFSKSGVGISVGVKGARISTGPRGTYIHIGRHGVYYRQRIDRPGSRPHAEAFDQGGKRNDGSATAYDPGVLRTADAAGLVESSGENTLSQINTRARRMGYAPFVAAASTILAAFVALLALSTRTRTEYAPASLVVFLLIDAIAIWVIGMILTRVVRKRDKFKCTTSLFYELEGDAQRRFAAIQEACVNLVCSKRIWRVVARQPNWDWKRNAGATSLITRREITVSQMTPPFIATNVDIYGIDLGFQRLLFFPDQVLVFQGGIYGAIRYESLSVTATPTRFIEDEGIPWDSEVVGYTWQYVRKDGGPDLRFKDNRRIPVVLYGLLELSSPTGLDLYLHVSNPSAALRFARGFSATDYWPYRECSGQESGDAEGGVPPSKPKGRSSYDILGVARSASFKEISDAYRRMAQMYHPDKVATLAPEFRELAERRMKEINAAYRQLKRGTSQN